MKYLTLVTLRTGEEVSVANEWHAIDEDDQTLCFGMNPCDRDNITSCFRDWSHFRDMGEFHD